MNILVSLVILALVFGMYYKAWQLWALRSYRRRSCQRPVWRSKFPERSNEEIRDFLYAFCDSFLVDHLLEPKFTPDDRMMDVYRLFYPIKGMADSMEFETFAMFLNERFGTSYPENMDEKWTLGMLFAHITDKTP